MLHGLQIEDAKRFRQLNTMRLDTDSHMTVSNKRFVARFIEGNLSDGKRKTRCF